MINSTITISIITYKKSRSVETTIAQPKILLTSETTQPVYSGCKLFHDNGREEQPRDLVSNRLIKRKS